MQPANDNAVLVSMTVACAMTSLSRSAINIKRDQGLFPQAVPLGEKRIAFSKAEILSWIEGRMAARAA